MGNSCNSKTNRKIGGLDVDARAPGGSWQNADVQVAADPADPTRAKVKVLKVTGPDIYRLVVPVKTKAGKNKDVSVIYEEGEEFCFAEDKTLIREAEACETSGRPSLKATEIDHEVEYDMPKVEDTGVCNNVLLGRAAFTFPSPAPGRQLLLLPKIYPFSCAIRRPRPTRRGDR